MQVAGEFWFQGSRSQVWALLNNDAVLARCIPGCQSLVAEAPDHYKIHLKIGLAAIKGSYDGTFTVTDRQEGESLTLVIAANGAAGFTNVTGKLALAEEGDRTKAVYDWNVSVGGPIAMVGGRVLGGVAKWIIGEFFATAQKELTARVAG